MRIAALIFLLGLIAACGGGGGSDPATNTGSQPPTNNPPTIAGTPETQVIRDQPYAFTPTASDVDGDRLTFSIANPPPWAVFDTDTGSITGTPTAVHIGTTLDVTISVSDSIATVSLAAFDLEVRDVPLGSATVSWDIPTTNADGTDLTDLAGFYVHYGQASQSYSDVAVVNDDTATSVLINDLEAGSWFFVVTAFDLAGNESAPSTEVSKVVDP